MIERISLSLLACLLVISGAACNLTDPGPIGERDSDTDDVHSEDTSPTDTATDDSATADGDSSQSDDDGSVGDSSADDTAADAACGSNCTAFGEHTDAACVDGVCERSCEAGWSDEDGDWLTDSPSSDSNGCEAVCEPSDNGTEVCDGQDNDCDGEVDENVGSWYHDGDGDGFGSDDDSVQSCERPSPSHVSASGDCDDSNPEVNPNATEGCTNQGCTNCNGLDDNCDGTVDETCPCDFQGISEGVCADSTIDAAGECQTPPDYSGSSEQQCNDGADNDCDGSTDCQDSDCSCPPGTRCSSSGECVESNCKNDLDDDQDGVPDCADPDCEGYVCSDAQIITQCCNANGTCAETGC